MNIENEFNIVLPALNSELKKFIKDYRSEFEKIEKRILSPNCYVNHNNGFLTIYLEHVSDQNTWIEFKVERREIYINVVGFGYSMWQVANGKKSDFINEVREFIQLAFSSDYKKILIYDKNNELIKEKLIWKSKPELEKISYFGSPNHLIKKLYISIFKKADYRTSEINYSKFL